jgi:hypothetical protein
MVKRESQKSTSTSAVRLPHEVTHSRRHDSQSQSYRSLQSGKKGPRQVYYVRARSRGQHPCSTAVKRMRQRRRKRAERPSLGRRRGRNWNPGKRVGRPAEPVVQGHREACEFFGPVSPVRSGAGAVACRAAAGSARMCAPTTSVGLVPWAPGMATRKCPMPLPSRTVGMANAEWSGSI